MPWPIYGTPPGNEEQPDVAAPIVGNRDVRLSPETDFSRVIQGGAVTLMESVHARHPVYIVAESLVLSEDAVLSGSQIWIFAEEVSGGDAERVGK